MVVEQRLRDWGWHHFGGEPDLGYPDHAPTSNPPRREYAYYQPEHDVDDASAVEYIITSAAQASLAGMRNLVVLRLEYVRRDLSQAMRAKKLGLSRRTYRRRLDEAQEWFWRASLIFDDAAQAWARGLVSCP